MCKRCTELDDKIEHYKRISTYITDQLTLDGFAGFDKADEGRKDRAPSRARGVRYPQRFDASAPSPNLPC